MPMYEYRCTKGHISEVMVLSHRDRSERIECVFCDTTATYIPSTFSGFINDYEHRAPITETKDIFAGTPLADGMEPCQKYKASYDKKPFIELSELVGANPG